MTDDDQFGRRLATLLRDELSDVHSAPNLTDRLRGRARRRQLLVGACAVAVVAITGAVGLVAVPGADRADPELVDVAHVRTQVTDALARSTDYVVLARTANGAPYRVDKWTDAATRRVRTDWYGDGKLSVSVVVTNEADGGQRGLQIDYLNRWYAHWQRTPAEMEHTFPDFFEDLPEANPESISQALADGTLEIVGKETIDGHETLRLRLETEIEAGPTATTPTTMELWVDADSYLPHRSTITTTHEFGALTRTTTYTWSERTPENLKVFDLTPPPGFPGGKRR
ncbi:hypothetical protein SAMN05421812_102701 [Asanoa hainanensis]|uniref:Uncharacterized protein n=1 Tax=Asanoa hainanensis TaxID=560556 RepID=A0A239J2Z2_9ACTN|nr:hypothetical protein [Asanoa hainanensis]SNT00281.1 hypothetical protein SAMN05421812_102701 [Asanoa hainanensis]